MVIERRFVPQNRAVVGLEARGEDGPPSIVGYAAVYYDGTRNTEYELWDGAVERILPGTFERAAKEDDVRGLFNHDPNQVLGRTSAGTLALKNDEKGLAYDIQPGATTVGRDVTEHIRRKDVQGSSFSFRVTDSDWRKEDDVDIREIRGVVLYDVGPVTFPAYETTTTGVRTAGDMTEARKSHAEWAKEAEMRVSDRAEADRKLAEPFS